MTENPQVNRRPSANGDQGERRQRREDGWARALRYLVAATYILLAVNLFIFIGVASQDYNRTVANQFTPAAKPAPGHAYLQAFLPIMAVGFFVGVAGALIHRKRTRRRSDRHYGGQILCILFSVVGLLLYLMLM